MISRDLIDAFLSKKKIAVVGASRNRKKFGNIVYRTLKERGNKVFAVNPSSDSIEDDKCWPSINDLPEKPDGIVFVTPPAQSEKIIAEIDGDPLPQVWFQRGAYSDAAIKLCESKGINPIYGHCILMFSEPVSFIHRLHRGILKLVGQYPKQMGGPDQSR